MDMEEDSPSFIIQEQELQDEIVDIESPLYVGLSPDKVWDHNVAYDRRFCYNHGETEYLLGTADRWMSPRDFDIRDAEGALEAMLQKHKDNPSEFQPHSRRCQAECWGILFSHVHSVLDKRGDGDRHLFLVRWKACWTPESYIIDQDWIAASLEANKNPNCRRRPRVYFLAVQSTFQIIRGVK
ncbi:hypothetical protein PV08_02499 [Exophiala spinifera]|uniref:Chromo domain-containing protein n=1 Tax=Exophiala spinifera TaxID=91928 RepID=A0A0D1YSH8_9EURO|nr:uncharacterized protein PV08_02499 [Exophiala spinifera]KIW18211.1 hypothetical protein PV08_02499 [Exophiala spinifera]